MLNKENNNRGFAGLSQLTSEIHIELEDTYSSNESLTCSFTSQDKIVFDLINIADWPTLPAPWSSVDSGETWVWEDFILTFQREAKTVLDETLERKGGKSRYMGYMNYPYVISVFYRYDKSPHKDKNRPIMVVALEQGDKGILKQLLEGRLKNNQRLEPTGDLENLVLGVFFGKTRYNLGTFNGDCPAKVIKEHFFSVIASKLGLSGRPKYIGDFKSAYGHPETGVPPRKVEPVKKRKGLKIFFAVAGVTCIVLVVLVFSEGNQWQPSNSFSYSSQADDVLVSTPPIKDIQYQKPPVGKTSDSTLNRWSEESTREAQKLLTKLGYSPGPIDGKCGRQTAAAVKSFQKDAGLAQNGCLDQSLLDTLKKRKANPEPPRQRKGLTHEEALGVPDPFEPQPIYAPENSAPKTTDYSIKPTVPVGQPLPRSGEVRIHTKKGCIAPFEIKSSSDSHYLLKLVDVFSGSTALTVFVQSGSNVNIEVPLGTYEVRYAAGGTWYGYEKLFGPETLYSKADETFTFERDGNEIRGFTITLYKVANGNLSTSPINASSF